MTREDEQRALYSHPWICPVHRRSKLAVKGRSECTTTIAGSLLPAFPEFTSDTAPSSMLKLEAEGTDVLITTWYVWKAVLLFFYPLKMSTKLLGVNSNFERSCETDPK